MWQVWSMRECVHNKALCKRSAEGRGYYFVPIISSRGGDTKVCTNIGQSLGAKTRHVGEWGVRLWFCDNGTESGMPGMFDHSRARQDIKTWGRVWCTSWRSRSILNAYVYQMGEGQVRSDWSSPQHTTGLSQWEGSIRLWSLEWAVRNLKGVTPVQVVCCCRMTLTVAAGGVTRDWDCPKLAFQCTANEDHSLLNFPRIRGSQSFQARIPKEPCKQFTHYKNNLII